MTGTFVVNGSPTKTQMVDSAGGRNQLAQLTAGAIVLLALLFCTAPLAYLPTAVLSTVVFLIGVELIDVRGLRRIFIERPWEFWVAMTTCTVVVLVGVEQSILMAIVMSLAVHTRHGYRVASMLLVIDAERGWLQLKASAPAQAIPGLMIYRFMHNMYYANAHVLTEDVRRLVQEAIPPLSWFCIDAAAVDDVDFTATETLRRLHAFLDQRGIRLVFCQLVDRVQEELDRSGLNDLAGAGAFYPSLESVAAAYRREQGAGTGATGGTGARD